MRLLDELSTAGRLGRAGFWLRHALVLPPALFLCIACEQLLGRPFDLPIAVLTTLFLVSVWGRRLHDRGRSAWCLLLVAVPVAGALVLLVECGLRASALSPYGPMPAEGGDYLVVRDGVPGTAR